jgi:hypothetical protein
MFWGEVTKIPKLFAMIASSEIEQAHHEMLAARGADAVSRCGLLTFS